MNWNRIKQIITNDNSFIHHINPLVMKIKYIDFMYFSFAFQSRPKEAIQSNLNKFYIQKSCFVFRSKVVYLLFLFISYKYENYEFDFKWMKDFLRGPLGLGKRFSETLISFSTLFFYPVYNIVV